MEIKEIKDTIRRKQIAHENPSVKKWAVKDEDGNIRDTFRNYSTAFQMIPKMKYYKHEKLHIEAIPFEKTKPAVLEDEIGE